MSSEKAVPSYLVHLLCSSAESDEDVADISSIVSGFQEQRNVDPDKLEFKPESLFVFDHGDEDDNSAVDQQIVPRKEMVLEKQHRRKMEWLKSELVQLKVESEDVMIGDEHSMLKVTPSLEKYKRKKQDQIMATAVVKDGFEKQEAVPPYAEDKKTKRLKRKEENKKTLGDDWFGMKAPEMTEELKNDMEAMSMRNQWTHERYYKQNDYKDLPKFFQIGTVMDSAFEFYTTRIPKKQRKKTIVDELLADAKFKEQNKKRYTHLLQAQASRARAKQRGLPSGGRKGGSRGRGADSGGRRGMSSRGGWSRGRGGGSRDRGGGSQGRGLSQPNHEAA